MDEDDSEEHAATFPNDWWKVLLLTILALGAISFPLFSLFFD